MFSTSRENDRRPVHKKRRLAMCDSHCSLDNPSRPQLSIVLNETRVLSAVNSVCSSCHRSFHVRPGSLAYCARCKSPTCNVCSRTCTGCVPSIPPTPALTFSPTPPATPLPSPRCVALALHTNTTHASDTTPRGRRRKTRDDDEDHEEQDDGGEDMDISTTKRRKDGVLPGCGRVICKNCCFENPQSDLTTCYDCYGLPYHILDQD